MNEKQIETLLYRSEDPSVDYKSEQYIFSKLDLPDSDITKADRAKQLEKKKSELLKDILAMANAWTEGTRYILLGFLENKPGLPTVVGLELDRLHDDAAFQQFIGSKVNAPVQFKYEVCEFRNHPIGVISIFKQQRPLFANETYGVVERNVVYVRRGSSTAVADPAEIGAMGAADNGPKPDVSLTVELVDNANVSVAGSASTVRVIEFAKQLPDFVDDVVSAGPFAFQMAGSLFNGHPVKDYWRSLANHLNAEFRSIPLRLRINNQSEFALTHCEVHIVASLNEHPVAFAEGFDSRKWPRSHRRPGDIALDIGMLRTATARDALRITGDACEKAVATFERLLPGSVVLARETLALLPHQTGLLTVVLTVYAAELRVPRMFQVSLDITAARESWDIDQLVAFDEQREQ